MIHEHCSSYPRLVPADAREPVRRAPLRGRHAGVSRDQLVEAALALTERSGADALTMRALAAQLDVSAATVYWHVGSREQLVDAVVERAAERYRYLALEATGPTERVVETAIATWRAVRSSPEITKLAYRAGRWDLLVHHLIDHLRAELAHWGLEGGELADAVWVVRSCVGGFLSRSMHSDASPSVAPDAASIEALLRRTLTAIVSDLLESPTAERCEL